MPRWRKGSGSTSWSDAHDVAGAWRSRHDLTDRLPESFQEVLDAVIAFADPILTTALTTDWDPMTRVWSSAAGTS